MNRGRALLQASALVVPWALTVMPTSLAHASRSDARPPYKLILVQQDLRQDEGVANAVDAISAKNYARAAAILEPLANAGNPTAQYKLAELYYFGLGVPQNFKKAADLYEAAAEHGLMYAQQNIAVMYVQGRGRAKNFALAAKGPYSNYGCDWPSEGSPNFGTVGAIV